MAKLSDLIPISEKNKKTEIELKGVKLPIDFNFLAMESIARCYDTPTRDGDFSDFEADLQWLTGKEQALNRRSFRVMSALIYGMVQAGGTECTIDEVKARLDFDMETVNIFEVCFEEFKGKYFQGEDLKKSNQPQDHPKSNKPKNNQKKNQKKKNNYNKNQNNKNSKAK
ncbi:hypothetical protein P7H60_13575 [Vagococcus carniphilus]|uniref:hypothetical protein n=1 Tax=Vagococcus carniphilus TaxID=218144 RepID=UPI00289051D7|nr:hypothetical protein [Vagococcus carniphilus]MDT2850179.1 hypothetical protein [Vagococcus carniphilus]